MISQDEHDLTRAILGLRVEDRQGRDLGVWNNGTVAQAVDPTLTSKIRA